MGLCVVTYVVVSFRRLFRFMSLLLYDYKPPQTKKDGGVWGIDVSFVCVVVFVSITSCVVTYVTCVDVSFVCFVCVVCVSLCQLRLYVVV